MEKSNSFSVIAKILKVVQTVFNVEFLALVIILLEMYSDEFVHNISDIIILKILCHNNFYNFPLLLLLLFFSFLGKDQNSLPQSTVNNGARDVGDIPNPLILVRGLDPMTTEEKVGSIILNLLL